MRAFEAFINGEKVATVGLRDGLLNVGIEWASLRAGEGMHVAARGFDGPAEEHVYWRIVDLKPGDEVLIRAVEAEVVDPPAERWPAASQ
jgi:hypothetical protein